MANIAQSEQKTSSFAKKRLEEAGVTSDNNTITLTNPTNDFPKVDTIEHDVFSEDTEGNVQILYYTLDREPIIYEPKGTGKMSHINAKEKMYFQTRFKNPKGDSKYILPKGQPTYPFLPPPLLDKFEKEEPIETLILTEGAFKAFKGSTCGLDVVGLPSITCFRDGTTKRLHTDVERLMGKCQVKQLVILWDGDCRNISETDLDFGTDLTRRVFNFQNSAKAIYELAMKMELATPLSIRFVSVNSKHLEGQPKGLDDLLNAFPLQTEAIVQELTSENAPPQYFQSVLMENRLAQFYKFFAMHDEKAFYELHSEQIADKEFNFRGSRYQFDFDNGVLKLVSSAWSERILWVGDEYFEITDTVTNDSSIEKKLLKRDIANLKRRFGKDFYVTMHYYDGFCNVPSHFDYQQVVGNSYNRFAPFTHTAEEGDCTQSIEFIKHIFGQRMLEYNGQETPQYELGLDYLQLLITEPNQKLPVLILYSKENNTGKSLFGKWLQYIIGQNAVTVGNQAFESEFNEFWADKLLIICEETLLEKKAASEKIKAFSTADKVSVNPKGQKQYSIGFFGKFQFYSNNEKMLYMTKHDQRFWIQEVPIPKHDDPDLFERLKEEIPAFLHFLKNRTLVAKRESRMYFHQNWLKNALFFKTVRLNEPSHVQELRERLKEIFIDFEQTEILMTIQDINYEFFKEKLGRPYLQQILKDYLNVNLATNKDGTSKTMRYAYFMHELQLQSDEAVPSRKVQKVGRPYLFKRADFVPSDEDSLGNQAADAQMNPDGLPF